ncbi:MAG: helix-turn-helix domain-containing protein [Bacillota bacterium]
MYNLAQLFRPITAKPENTETYIEILPCDILKPYVRCFWGSPQPKRKFWQENFKSHSTIIIPDTCMDIIFEIDYLSNEVSSVFCGINDTSFSDFRSNKTAVVSTFGIRFHFWAVHLFADICMREVLNVFTDVEEYFGDFKKALENILMEKTTMEEKIPEVEKYLMNRLNINRRTNDDVMNAVYYILKAKGIISIAELCKSVAISQRQLERLFLEYIGVSPKKTADLVRFQNVWQDMYYSKTFDFQDVVFKYKYSDQSHFVNDFKKYAGRTPLEALIYAK